MDSKVAVSPASLLEVITVAQRDLARRVAGVLTPEGFTVDQWRILRALADGAGHPMGELAESLRIPNPTLTRSVDGLVDQSLVYRRQAVQDRRRLDVHLARQGHARLVRLDALVKAQEVAACATPEFAGLVMAVGQSVST